MRKPERPPYISIAATVVAVGAAIWAYAGYLEGVEIVNEEKITWDELESVHDRFTTYSVEHPQPAGLSDKEYTGQFLLDNPDLLERTKDIFVGNEERILFTLRALLMGGAIATLSGTLSLVLFIRHISRKA